MVNKIILFLLLTSLIYKSNAQSNIYKGGKGDGYTKSSIILKTFSDIKSIHSDHIIIFQQNGSLSIINIKEGSKIEIVNLLGQIFFQLNNCNSSSMNIDCPTFYSNGTFLVKVIYNEDITIRKFVFQ